MQPETKSEPESYRSVRAFALGLCSMIWFDLEPRSRRDIVSQMRPPKPPKDGIGWSAAERRFHPVLNQPVEVTEIVNGSVPRMFDGGQAP